jgi:hypothetical protein
MNNRYKFGMARDYSLKYLPLKNAREYKANKNSFEYLQSA